MPRNSFRNSADAASKPRRILLDALKLNDVRMDGIKRYVVELLEHLTPLARRRTEWQLDITCDGRTAFPLGDIAGALRGNEEAETPLRDPLIAMAEAVDDRKRRLLHAEPRALHARAGDWLGYRLAKFHLSLHRRWRKVHRLRKPGSRAPRLIQENDYDLVHLTLPNTWKHFRGLRARLLTTVHDLSHIVCPELQTESNVRSLEAGLRFAHERGSGYIAVSHATRRDMLRLLELEQSRIEVAPLACDRARFSPRISVARRTAVRERHQLGNEPFLLAVATLEPRKNLASLVRAFRLLRARRPELPGVLAIGGGFGWGNNHELLQEMRADANIRLLGYLPEEELPALLAEARAFCFPSHYEGFGLPLLEAMSCGTPVVFGDNSSLPEIAGPGGVPVPAHDVHALSLALEQLLQDDALRRELSAKALEQAARFSWNQTASLTWRAYEQALAETPGAAGRAA